MGQILHASATTTESVRRAIQRSKESVRALARRHGVSPTTVQKWRKRTHPNDVRMGPKAIHSTVLTAEEEAMVVAFRPVRRCGACLGRAFLSRLMSERRQGRKIRMTS